VYAEELQQTQRLNILHGAMFEARLGQAVSLLRAALVEPLLIKGWSVARFYPEEGLRPYGDIDLVVRPSEYTKALKVLNSPEAVGNTVDLHKGLRRLDRHSFEEVYECGEFARLGEIMVKVPSREDHLRILAAHALGHGVWRPIWLCDVALLLETRPSGFDWSRCFGRDARRAEWVWCALGLAHALLGAEIRNTPIEGLVKGMPGWVVESVRRQWNGRLERHVSQQRPILSLLRSREAGLGAILSRWPSPVEATVSVGGSFDSFPRLPYQLASSALRASRLLRSEL
jgi:hypothetical protein